MLDPADAAWLERRLTPHPLGTYESPLPIRGPVGNGLPRTYVDCTTPSYAPPSTGSRTGCGASPAGNWRDLATGHDAMVSAPGPLADLLVELGRG